MRFRPGTSLRLLLALLIVAVLPACTSRVRGPELALEYYNLGNAYYDLGDYGKAVLYYRKAISIDGENTKARFNLALALVAGGRSVEAEKVLEELLLKDPRNQGLQEALAYSYYSAGDNGKAIALYQSILEESPANDKVRYNLGMLLWKEGEKESALEAFDAVVQDDPGDLEALHNRGQLLLELGRNAEALEALQLYLQQRPEDSGAYLLLAAAYRAQQRYDRALDAYRQALALDENLTEAWFASAVIQLTRIEDPDRGLTALRRALDGGFRDEKQLRALLDDPDLMEPEKVKALLEEKQVLPSGSGSE